jgi:hypothetical protein
MKIMNNAFYLALRNVKYPNCGLEDNDNMVGPGLMPLMRDRMEDMDVHLLVELRPLFNPSGP